MTPRRVAAFAQTLALFTTFALGLQLLGAASVEAAIAPAEPRVATVLDTDGKGIGCAAGTRKFKGPREPRKPPWPPGAEPTPSPTPVPTELPSAIPSADPLDPEPSASAEPTADGPTMLLASDGLRVAQAEPAAGSTPAPDDGFDADIRPDATTAPEVSEKARKSKLILGIDVSHHNGDIDFDKVREGGNRFVFIKATQDTEFIDPRFLTNMARARAAGLAAGGYHFFDYTLDGKAQADHFIDRLELGDAIMGALPPVVDVECWAPIGSSTQVVAQARLRDFVARVYERTGRLPLLYTSVFMWKQVMGNAEGFERLPLWAACWGCSAPPSLAPGWDDWAFWQTGVNRVPGVGRLDGNYFNGSRKELKALKLRPLAIEGGDIATRKQRVVLDLGGRDARQMRTSPDGQRWSAWSPVRARARAKLGPEEGEQTLYVQLRAGPGLKSPVVSDTIMVDRTGPELSGLEVSLREGSIGRGPASIPVAATWSARDVVAGLSDAIVSVNCGEGQVQRSEAPGSAVPGELADWSAQVALFGDAPCAVTAVGKDGVGNSTRETVRGLVAEVVTARDGAPLSGTVQGDQVGVIAQRGPDAGRAAVMIDGEAVGLVDLYAPLPGVPEVVFVADLDAASSQRILVEPTGTSDPASSGSNVVVDGFVVLSGASSAA